jgi:predicted dehydrogenase
MQSWSRQPDWHLHLNSQQNLRKNQSARKIFMATHGLGIIMHGVTGRMGMNQHLIRSIVAIRNQGGVTLSNGDKVMPDPILIGRNAEKIEALAKANGIDRFGTDLDKALANKEDTVFFDAGTTQMRPTLLAKAIRAGKHVYCEKPIATNLNEAVEIARLAEKSGVKHGAVQDKLFLPGLRKLDMLRKAGFFGKMLSVRIEFGYWVFEGDLQPIQRPSWNYRKEDGGGIILDMVCHWRYVLDNLFGEVQSVSCLGATHIPTRWDEANKPYECTADDAAYATFELKGHQGEHVVAQVNSSWTTRVNRDDLVTFHVDGTHGSAVAGLQSCKAQSRVNTPRPVWNPDVKQTMTFTDQWQEVPDTQFYDNGFKIQWEHFIRHIVENEPYRWTLPEGAKGVQLVEAALQSWQERRWIDVPPLKM